jgi:hypothetical protein
MKYLAIDPGGATGIAEFDSETREWAQYTLRGDHHLTLWDLLCQDRWDVVIYERFLYQRRAVDKGVSLVLDSVEYIGVVKFWLQWTKRVWERTPTHMRDDPHIPGPPPVLVEQAPSAMQLWDDRKLRAAGLWTTDSPHARDATRHLLYYLTAGKDNTHRDLSFMQMTKRPG